MKTSGDPRHIKRAKALKDLFAHSFHSQRFTSPIAKAVSQHYVQLDEAIAKAAPAWPLPKVSKVDLAILRLATYELLIAKTEPAKVIIDEAVELAKEYGNDASGSFVNGVLGTILKTFKPTSKKGDTHE